MRRRGRAHMVSGVRAAIIAALVVAGLIPSATAADALARPATAGNPGLSGSASDVAGAASITFGSPILNGFRRPVLFVPRGAGHQTGFIVEQAGIIRRVVYNATTDTWSRGGVFLDISSRVHGPSPDASEQGLLGLAFPPGFDDSGRFYVYYTAEPDGADTVSEFRLRSSTQADPNSERRLLHVPDPYPNHNGGMLLFQGHNLFIAMGDGGGGGDPGNRAQDLNVRLGKILRIDPRDPDGSGPRRYSVPADNPFVGVANAKPEIWSLGLRNPWRFSIDPPTGDLWIGDVGQCQYEEVDRAGNGRGVNFGWRKLEGTHVYAPGECTEGTEAVCQTDCETLPVADYSHAGGNCAVTGGWVYRGSAYPAWRGHYLYADFCSGTIWTLAAGSPGTPAVVSTDRALNISSFAQDQAGELYAVDLGGSIYALTLVGTP